MLDIMQLFKKRAELGDSFNDARGIRASESQYIMMRTGFYDKSHNLDKEYLTKENMELVRKQDPYDAERQDAWVDLILMGADDKFLITSAYGVRVLLNKGFFIKGIYEMGGDSGYLENEYLIELSKHKLKTLDIGIWRGEYDVYGEEVELASEYQKRIELSKKWIKVVKETLNDEATKKLLIKFFKEKKILNVDDKNPDKAIKQAIEQEEMDKEKNEQELLDYTAAPKIIENFINGKEKTPIKTELLELKQIAISDEFKGIYYPRYFSDTAFKVRALLKGESLVALFGVARFLDTVHCDDVPRNCVVGEEDEYYFNALQKGDITIKVIGKYKYSINMENEDFEKPKYLSSLYNGIIAIIRPQNISPEYLCLYLQSEIGQMVLECYGLDEQTPILPPKNNAAFYKEMFRAITSGEFISDEFAQSPKEQALTQIVLDAKNRGEFKVEFIDELVAKGESLGDILDAELWAKYIIKQNNKGFKESIENDINELNACFKAKSYKAVIMLAGSILEAFVTDWLGEIHGKDYFTEAYRVPGMGRNADFEAYIDAIKEIKKPEWDKEAEKAHFIRRKRNLIHAGKSYKELKKGNEINEKVCREVIEYLKDIIKTRGI